MDWWSLSNFSALAYDFRVQTSFGSGHLKRELSVSDPAELSSEGLFQQYFDRFKRIRCERRIADINSLIYV